MGLYGADISSAVWSAVNALPGDESGRQKDGRFGFKFDPRWFGLPPAPHERLDDVRCPALLIRGAHSTLLTREGADAVVAKLPSARLIEISGAGHNVHLERPTEVIVAITEHLSAQQRAAS